MSYTIKYLNNNNEWVDYVEKRSGILTYNGEKWEDGSDNELSPAITVSFYDGKKWIRKYPNAHITYQKVFKGSGYKFTHTKNSTSTWGNDTTTGKDAKAGTWTSGAIYTGWLGIKKPTSLEGGSVGEIMSVECNYTRRGVGHWEEPLKLQLVPSTLTSATGTGTYAHNSKRGATIYSDTGMVVCSGTGKLSSGSTTFNNDNAKTILKNFLNGSYNSLLLGQKESKGDYIAITDIELIITYTSNIASATFNVEDSKLLSSKYKRKKSHTMFIYDNEIGLSFDEIMKRREENNIKDIKLEDVTFK